MTLFYCLMTVLCLSLPCHLQLEETEGLQNLRGCSPFVNAGDTVKKLMWRMKNGEVPLKREPKSGGGTDRNRGPGQPSHVLIPITAPRTAAELRGLLVYMHRCWSTSSTQSVHPTDTTSM